MAKQKSMECVEESKTAHMLDTRYQDNTVETKHKQLYSSGSLQLSHYSCSNSSSTMDSHNEEHQNSKISNSQLCNEFSHHEPGIARLNNGSFGSCPASIIATQQEWQLRFLRQPDDFYFNHLQNGILESRAVIKNLINADDIEEVSIIDNVTTAAAIVLQQICWRFVQGKYEKGDKVVMLSCTYGAVKKSICAYVSHAGGDVVEIQLPFPVKSNEEIIDEFRRGLVNAKGSGKKVRLAVIDHISSMPSFVLPIKELVQTCRDEMVDQVFVDAAHSIGSIDVDVKHIGADFYTSNLHKWFFCPPSVSFLYSKKSTLFELHHPVVSHEYCNGLGIECSWVGTRDYSAQLVIPSVLDFVNRFEGGLDGIQKRNHAIVVEMGKMLAEAWGTELGSPPEMSASMVMVGLPGSLGISSEKDTFNLRTYLRVQFGIEVHMYYQTGKDREVEDQSNGTCITAYARVSHHVYNTIDDYYRLRDAVDQIVQDGLTCEMLFSQVKI